jgi:hypothetical protein
LLLFRKLEIESTKKKLPIKSREFKNSKAVLKTVTLTHAASLSRAQPTFGGQSYRQYRCKMMHCPKPWFSIVKQRIKMRF